MVVALYRFASLRFTRRPVLERARSWRRARRMPDSN